MKTVQKRLEELKEEIEPQLESRMIFLLNPKDTKTLEAVSAWTVLRKPDCKDSKVDDDASMDDLWRMFPPDLNEFAVMLNVDVIEANKRFEQLKRLELIYPDGSVAKLAVQLVGLYIRTQAAVMESKIKKSKNEK